MPQNPLTGKETDVNYLFRRIKELTGSSIPEKHADAKPGEQLRSVLGCDKAAQILGWEPTVEVDHGLELTVDWFARRIEAIKA